MINCEFNTIKCVAECIGIDSRLQRTAVANCSYPFGLAITRDNYYWTDWIS